LLLLVLGNHSFAAESKASGAAEQHQAPPRDEALVSWQDARGEWNFVLFEWWLDRLPEIEDIRRFPAFRGLDQLTR
jgi:hypothetical protein